MILPPVNLQDKNQNDTLDLILYRESVILPRPKYDDRYFLTALQFCFQRPKLEKIEL
jgi:hypothetical protein